MFAFPLNLLLCRRGERLKLWCSRKHVCLLRVFVLVCPCAWLHIRVHQRRVKLWNLFAWDRSHVGSFSFFLIFFYALWCGGETLRLCVLFEVFSFCILWGEISFGCSSITAGSSFLKCSSGGAICPAADAECSLATWIGASGEYQHSVMLTVDRNQDKVMFFVSGFFFRMHKVGRVELLWFTSAGMLVLVQWRCIYSCRSMS